MVTSFAVVDLKSEEDITERRGYIAVGSSLVRGEETTCIGTVHLLEVNDVVPEPGMPLTKNKMGVLVSQRLKGAAKGVVSALASVNGYLVSCTGTRDSGKIFVCVVPLTQIVNRPFLTSVPSCVCQIATTSYNVCAVL